MIRFSRHAMNKLAKELSKLNITEELVKETIKEPDEVLYDTVTGRYVAIKMRHNLAVIYEKNGEDIFVITTIFISRLKELVIKRKRSGRWI